MEEALFYPLAAGSLAAALSLVCSRKPLYSSLWLLALTGCLAGLSLLLGAELVAIMQIISASGLALVLLMLSLTAFREGGAELRIPRPIWPAAAGIALGILILAAVSSALVESPLPGPRAGRDLSAVIMQEGGNAQAVGALLLERYLLPLEVVALILLVALIGGVSLVKRAAEGKE